MGSDDQTRADKQQFGSYPNKLLLGFLFVENPPSSGYSSVWGGSSREFGWVSCSVVHCMIQGGGAVADRGGSCEVALQFGRARRLGGLRRGCGEGFRDLWRDC